MNELSYLLELQAGFEHTLTDIQRHVLMLTDGNHAVCLELSDDCRDSIRADVVRAQARWQLQALEEGTGFRNRGK